MLTHVLLVALMIGAQAAPRPTPRPSPRPAPRPASQPAPKPAPVFFTAPDPPAASRGKQAVVDTSAGTVTIDLLPDAAPNQVGLFMKLAREGAYAGTAVHRVVKYGVVQAGDPLSRDSSRAAEWGTGGGNQVRFETNTERLTAGAVVASLLNGARDTAGAQFFICVTDQPALDGHYTVFGRVSEGMEILQAMSAVEADPEGRPLTRIDVKSVTIRDAPPERFLGATVEALTAFRTVVETTMGAFTIEVWPDKAPETVRSFLKLADIGVYDGIKVHRVVPNFVIQTGALTYRMEPLKASQQRFVRNLPPEFTDTPNVPGIVSMARGEDPRSGATSFFVCVGQCRALDGQYTVFGRVVEGMSVVQAIAAVPADGETPRTDVVVTRVRVEPK